MILTTLYHIGNYRISFLPFSLVIDMTDSQLVIWFEVNHMCLRVPTISDRSEVKSFFLSIDLIFKSLHEIQFSGLYIIMIEVKT